MELMFDWPAKRECHEVFESGWSLICLVLTILFRRANRWDGKTPVAVRTGNTGDSQVTTLEPSETLSPNFTAD
jgi:hypothetical protein